MTFSASSSCFSFSKSFTIFRAAEFRKLGINLAASLQAAMAVESSSFPASESISPIQWSSFLGSSCKSRLKLFSASPKFDSSSCNFPFKSVISENSPQILVEFSKIAIAFLMRFVFLRQIAQNRKVFGEMFHFWFISFKYIFVQFLGEIV